MGDVKFTTGDPERDFFEQNPHWRYLDSSQKLLKQVDKELASKLRWAAFYIQDPDSKYHRYPMIKRVELVNVHYLKEDFTIQYDPETMRVVNEDFGYLFKDYAQETMSKLKRDYYEREVSYQLLVQQERIATDLKLKADVQVKMDKIYEGLKKAREEFESENEEEATRARGKQQPGIMFE